MYVFSWLAIVICAIPGLRGALRAAKEPPEAHCKGAAWGLSILTFVMLGLAFLLYQTNNFY